MALITTLSVFWRLADMECIQLQVNIRTHALAEEERIHRLCWPKVSPFLATNILLVALSLLLPRGRPSKTGVELTETGKC